MLTQQERIGVAHTIIEQLGGVRFQVMTGAKQFIALDCGVSFRVPLNAAGRPNHVEITLDLASDTYNMTFRRIRGANVKVIASHTDIYADMLRDLFEDSTGLVLTAPRVYRA